MEKLIAKVGNAAAVLGLVVFAVSILARLIGVHWLGAAPGTSGFGLEIGTLFESGVAFMVLGCLAKIHLLGSK